jgi:pimeloyl-ACP methyl ester carboxylesterase
MEQAYLQVAPDPQHWPVLVEKMKESMVESKGLPAAAVQSIQAPTLLVYGDTDLVRPEYAVEMFRLLGGRPNYFMGQPAKTQLAILPATSHYDIFTRADLLLPLVTPFLDTP